MFLPWTLDRQLLERCKASQSREEQQQVLSQALQLDSRYPGADESSRARRDIHAQMMLELFAFTERENMDLRQTSTLLAIVEATHRACCENRSRASFPSVSEGFAVFERLLLQHSVQRPPFSIGVFDFAQLQAITQFVTNTYFRQYQLTQRVFGTHCRLDLQCASSTLAETVEYDIPPLSAATESLSACEDEFAVVSASQQDKLDALLTVPPALTQSLSADEQRLVASLLADAFEHIQSEARNTLLNQRQTVADSQSTANV